MSTVPPKLMIDDTYGVAFVGALIATTLYGITMLQTYFYFIYYPKDSTGNKILVSMIWILDTIQVALASLCMYHYLVTNYANPPALAIGHWSLFLTAEITIIVSFCVKCFFTLQIFRLSKPNIRWWLTSVIMVFVLAHFLFGTETIVYFFIKRELSTLADTTLFTTLPFFTFTVISDIFIAAALCILLDSSRTGFEKTNRLITTLIIYAINRCLLTSILAVAEVTLFLVAKRGLWYLAIDFIIGKLYANSLLAALNSRHALGYNNISSTMNIPLEPESGMRRGIDTVNKVPSI